jgi:tetratricopeptide (TPR) repeat protein
VGAQLRPPDAGCAGAASRGGRGHRHRSERRGRHAWALRTPQGFENAVKYFDEATKRDPEFALGYAGLADAFSLYPAASLVSRSADNYARAKAAAEKAIALDDTLAEAHTSLGAVYFFGDRNVEAAQREFRRALELNPHYPTANQWYAIVLSESAKHEEAKQHAEEAVKQDPLNGVMHRALGLVRYYARDFAAADASTRKALDLNPQLPLARVVLAKSLVLQGKTEETAARSSSISTAETAAGGCPHRVAYGHRQLRRRVCGRRRPVGAPRCHAHRSALRWVPRRSALQRARDCTLTRAGEGTRFQVPGTSCSWINALLLRDNWAS